MNWNGAGGGGGGAATGGGATPRSAARLASSWLFDRNIVNSLGPLRTGSTGGASAVGARKTLVASTEPGRLANGFAAGGWGEGVGEKNGFTG